MNQNGFLGVVQFIHPGNEHKVSKDGWTKWNDGMHARKFMVARSRLIDSSGTTDETECLFWGEWEGPSQSVYSWSPSADLPKNLVVPRFPGTPRYVAGLQNTDPYVFGDCFKYTLCKQVNKNGRESGLTRLLPGTLVLFGSKVHNRFVLDTALVVSERTVSHSRHTWRNELQNLSSTYVSVTLEQMYNDPNTHDEAQYKLYLGATDLFPYNDTFSFFPAMPASAEPLQFARPNIQLEGIINQKLMMGQKFSAMNHTAIRSCWQTVVQQVHDAGLGLGTFAEEPPLSTVPDHVWPH